MSESPTPIDELPNYPTHDLSDVNQRLDRIEKTLDGLRDGVNTIGQMMNQVVDAFGQIMTQVQNGGLGSLLGTMMGKKNG